ncbi:MAG: signal peptidase II [Acidobacteria bacterium]|nr:signal peptidase II [Acidobacteriota bacterium]
MAIRTVYFLITLLILGLDQATKCWATSWLRPRILLDVLPGLLRFTYATNRGVAFSLFADTVTDIRYILAAAALVAAVVVVLYQWQTPVRMVRVQVGLSLMLAGIIGNLIDRIRLGEVVDFIDLHWRDTYYWPTFNVADAAICVGAGLLAWQMIQEGRAERRYVS